MLNSAEYSVNRHGTTRDNIPLLLIALHPKCKLFEIERGLPEYLETPLERTPLSSFPALRRWSGRACVDRYIRRRLIKLFKKLKKNIFFIWKGFSYSLVEIYPSERCSRDLVGPGAPKTFFSRPGDGYTENFFEKPGFIKYVTFYEPKKILFIQERYTLIREE